MKELSPQLKKKYGWLNPNDVVFTPDRIAQQIVEIFKPTGRILEPSKGEGAFLKALPINTEWCEITEERDFFEETSPAMFPALHYDWIVTNPPYSDFDRFLQRSFDISDNVVFLVPLAKVFKSMGTLRRVKAYGGMKKIWLIAAGRCGLPFGFPAAAIHFKKGYTGTTEIIFAED